MSEESLFSAALAISDPAERSAYLEAACDGDPTLRRRVDDLLRAHGESGSFLRPLVAQNATAAFTVGPGGVLETLAASFGPVPRLLLRDTDARPEAAVVRPMSEPGAHSARYRIDGEIARGGMGTILKGRDPDLGREVAIKVLRDDFLGSPEMVRRFIEEAQIGGQLQHPGIVPIYELGAFADRRPFFAMKLVKGHTLAALLESREGPAAELPRFLGIVEAVALTVAYAHARGVIHRDLKPSNVMVGSFGEVQVMDWGLAKVLPRGGLADDATAGRVDAEEDETEAMGPDLRESVIATARSGPDGSGRSRAGSVLGTPSYMAPEQARGEVDRVDERADVFALGSILCEVLTGRPAFVGRDSVEIQRLAARGETSDALSRLGACGADAELVELARDCLAREPEGRPRSAGAVSGRVTSYLDGVQDRLRRAELARVEERGRRRLTTLAAAAAILMTAGVGGGLAWLGVQRAERVARTTRVVDDALAEASRLAGEAGGERGDPSRWAAALVAARRAEGLLEQGEADEALRRRVVDRVADLSARRDAIEVDRRLLARLEAARGGYDEAEDRGQTDAAYASAFRAAGLDLDAAPPEESGAWIAGRSDPAELTSYLDDWAAVRRTSGRPEADWRRLVDAARAADRDPWRDALRAKLSARDGSAAAFRALADDVAALDGQPAASLVLLARQLRVGLGDRDRSEVVLRRAWRRFPGDFWVNIELAWAQDKGPLPLDHFPRPAESLRYLTAALAIRPANTIALHGLGVALEAAGDVGGAVAAFREAVRLKPHSGRARHDLGYALKLSGDLDGAVASFREALRLDPDGPAYPANLAIALSQKGDFDGALSAHREAIRRHPESARAYVGLARFLHDVRRDDSMGEAQFRELTRLDPGNALPHKHLGLILSRQGRRPEAAAELREASRLAPGDTEVWLALGLVQMDRGRPDEAVVALRELVRLAPDYAAGHHHLGVAEQWRGDDEAAIAASRRSLAIQPRNAESRRNIGLALLSLGRPDEALAEFREAEKISPQHYELPGEFRMVAVAPRLPAILHGEDRPADSLERIAFADLCYRSRLFAAAARLYDEAIKEDPSLVGDWRTRHAESAARYAILSGCVEGRDQAPAPAERAALLRRARDLLRSELDAWDRAIRGKKASKAGAVSVLHRWTRDYALAFVRETDELDRLPGPERREWQAFWGAVEDLRRRAESGP